MKRVFLAVNLMFTCLHVGACSSPQGESTLTDFFGQRLASGVITPVIEPRNLKPIAQFDSHGNWRIQAENKPGSISWNVVLNPSLLGHRHFDPKNLAYEIGSPDAEGSREHVWYHGNNIKEKFQVEAHVLVMDAAQIPAGPMRFSGRFLYSLKGKSRPSAPPDIVGIFPGASLSIVCSYINEAGKPRFDTYAVNSKEHSGQSDSWIDDQVSFASGSLDLAKCRQRSPGARIEFRVKVADSYAIRFRYIELQMFQVD